MDSVATMKTMAPGQKPTSVRWGLMALVFVTCLVAYLDRVNLSVCATQIMNTMGFDRVMLGYSMSAFFFAYSIMQIPGGIMAERWGIRKNGTLALAWWSVFTIFTPFAWSFASFVAIRMLFGLGEGPMYPNNGAFFAGWFNPKEKALPSSLMVVGTFLALAVGPPLSVTIVDAFGWQSVFYIYGFFGLLIAAAWFLYSRNRPHEHPGVNAAELLFITEAPTVEAAMRKGAAAKKLVAPWGRFLRSSQFWAFGLLYLCCNYMLFLFVSWLPLYLQESRGLSFKAMGVMAMLPWLVNCGTTLLSGIWSDRQVRGGATRFKARTMLGIIGLIGCGGGLYLATAANSVTQNIAMLCVSLGFMGLCYTGVWTAAQDLGRQFGGTVVSWMNFWGTIGGIIAPTLTAMLVGIIGWESTFAASACIPFLGVVCWIFVRPDRPLVPVETA